jgi:hypothetical protein
VNAFGAIEALVGAPEPVNPQDPPFLQELAKNSHGPLTSAMQGGFALMSAVTILGSVQMMRRKTWTFGLIGAILSIVNFGNGCCLLGLPFGIWAIVTLNDAEVKDAFS